MDKIKYEKEESVCACAVSLNFLGDKWSLIIIRDLFRNRTIGTDSENGVSCPDFSKVAECFGLHYQKIETVPSLDDGLRALFEYPGPVLCEIIGREDQGYIELGHARGAKDGRMVRRPLEDQAPFLDRDVFLREMLIDPVDQ